MYVNLARLASSDARLQSERVANEGQTRVNNNKFLQRNCRRVSFVFWLCNWVRMHLRALLCHFSRVWKLRIPWSRSIRNWAFFGQQYPRSRLAFAQHRRGPNALLRRFPREGFPCFTVLVRNEIYAPARKSLPHLHDLLDYWRGGAQGYRTRQGIESHRLYPPE